MPLPDALRDYGIEGRMPIITAAQKSILDKRFASSHGLAYEAPTTRLGHEH